MAAFREKRLHLGGCLFGTDGRNGVGVVCSSVVRVAPPQTGKAQIPSAAPTAGFAQDDSQEVCAVIRKTCSTEFTQKFDGLMKPPKLHPSPHDE